MALLAQCGYGRGDRIEAGLGAEAISGVILSPRDETRPRLETFSHQLRDDFPDAEILFDPQFYAATLRAPRDGRLPEYPYYQANSRLSRNQFGPRQAQRYAQQVLDYQCDQLGQLSYLISPSVSFESFDDSWSQIALGMAEAAIEYRETLSEPPPLLCSIVVSETGLRNSQLLGEYLDTLSTLETHGFYILIARDPNANRMAMDARSMSNLMFMVHVLSLNDYHVKVGYSDWLGLLATAAGADSTATGWFQTLKQFSMARFLPATGGGRPRKRYASGPMLSSVLISPELEDIYRANLIERVLSGTPHDGILRDGPAVGEARWTEQIGCVHHWLTLSGLISSVEAGRTVTQRMGRLIGLIDTAERLYTRLAAENVSIEADTGPGHLELWRDAMDDFSRQIQS